MGGATVWSRYIHIAAGCVHPPDLAMLYKGQHIDLEMKAQNPNMKDYPRCSIRSLEQVQFRRRWGIFQAVQISKEYRNTQDIQLWTRRPSQSNGPHHVFPGVV